MENPYLNTPALLGLSQHPAGFSEALRMRTLAHQAIADSKDFSSCFPVSTPLGLRSFEFPPLPSPLFLSSPFLSSAAAAAAGLEPRLPFGSSAFHPVSSAAFDRKFFPLPASVAAKLGAKLDSSGEHGEVSSTAALVSLPTGHGVEEDERASSASERSSPEEALRRRISPVDRSMCPVCGLRLRIGEMAEHLRLEIDHIHLASVRTASPPERRLRIPPIGAEAFHRVRANRQLRLRCKSRKRRISSGDGGDCNMDGEHKMLHFSSRRSATITSLPAVSVAAAAVAALGSFPAAGGRLAAVIASCGGSAVGGVVEDEDVDVMGDADGAGWTHTTSQLSTGAGPACDEGVPDTTAERNSSRMSGDASSAAAGPALTAGSPPATAAVHELQQLRCRLQQLEGEAARCRCGVCQQPYRHPLVSTVCWHVHCQLCWTDALDADGKCPQCKAGGSTDDLRPVHV